MKSTLYKEIGYAYPSSSKAKELGFVKKGCYFVDQFEFEDGHSKIISSKAFPAPKKHGDLNSDEARKICYYANHLEGTFFRYDTEIINDAETWLKHWKGFV
jgi:hypothetical protein